LFKDYGADLKTRVVKTTETHKENKTYFEDLKKELTTKKSKKK